MSEKPRILVLATGGTIAGRAASAAQTVGYKAGDLSIGDLLDAVPQLREIARIEGEQVANIDSCSMTGAIWLDLSRRINAAFAEDRADGVVVTHGTDTLEETAYFLNLTVHSRRPVVVVGSMRPATAVSADGPLNLINAVRLAGDPAAAGQGVLIAMNDQILAARDATKASTYAVETFRSPDMGCLGYIIGGRNLFYRSARRLHTVESEFHVEGLKALPRVDIVYSHTDDDGLMAQAAADAGARGIVHAGTGMGSVHAGAAPTLERLAASGIAVVRSTHAFCGAVVPTGAWPSLITADTLNPQKARVLLQLALTVTNERSAIQAMFDRY